MAIKTAKFIISNTDPQKCPTTLKPEYAFIGRSNVGKSSLINMLTNTKGLAKTSGRPGKTQLINHFMINDEWYLVDLPGYGYAKVSLNERRKWNKFIREYMLHRNNLTCVMVLLDSRHSPQEVDLEFMTWLGVNGLPFAMIFTKADKLSKRILSENIKAYKDKMLETWEELPPTFISSAESKLGKEEIISFIEETNKSL